MRRERPLPPERRVSAGRRVSVLAILTVGALIAGSLMCVIGTVVAGRRMGEGGTFLPLGLTRATSEPTTTLTLVSPADGSGPPTTQTVDGLATPSTPDPATIPPSPDITPTRQSTQVPTGTPTPSPAGPTGTPESAAPPPATRTSKPPDTNPTTIPQPPAVSPTSTSEPPSAMPTNTPSPTTVVATPRGPAQVTGRLVRDGTPVPAEVTVKLEDQAFAIAATATTDAHGIYTFDNLTISGTGINVLFAQEWNEQYDVGDVVSWAWLGPLTIPRGATLELPDFDISLQGFEQVNPPSGDSFSAGEISAQNPLIFEWSPYPQASAYWVDLTKGDDLNRVWQSALVDTTNVPFDGTLDDGSRATADTYWWGIGARQAVGDYHLTVYGYLPTLVITP